jgi:RNA polymerase sigma-70 factor (ECF subfamily)
MAASFDAFFDTFKKPLVGVAYLLTGELQTAQDLTQEAFLQTWRRWAQVREYDDPKAWTRRVLLNLVTSDHRKNKVRRRTIESVTSIPPPDELHLVLTSALRTLPENQMKAVVLHDGVGMSVRELASEMGVAEGTVKSWLSRGRAVAAAALDDASPSMKEGHAPK